MKSKLFLTILVLFSLAGCDAIGKTTPGVLPTIPLGGTVTTPQTVQPLIGGVVIASGVVAPAQQAQLVFVVSGRVKSVGVNVGDHVTAGQALVELEGQESLQAAISAAQYELELAKQALKDLTTQAEAARVQAMQAIVTYAQAVKNAQYALDNYTVPPEQASMDPVEALNLMKKRLDEARAAFEPYKNRSTDSSTRQSLKDALDEAQADYNSAVKRLQLAYDLQVAEEQLSRAEIDYEMYKTGPDPDKVLLAEARQANAEAQLAAAQASLDNLTLSAPFAGVVSKISVHNGEWVTIGQPVLALVDLEHLRIETTDLSERDVPQVKVGQAVTIFVKALNLDIGGKVSQIAPLADILGGDVVYKVTIELDQIPAGLRAGMSVDVQFSGK